MQWEMIPRLDRAVCDYSTLRSPANSATCKVKPAGVCTRPEATPAAAAGGPPRWRVISRSRLSASKPHLLGMTGDSGTLDRYLQTAREKTPKQAATERLDELSQEGSR